MSDTYNLEGYSSLACAVVEQAAIDYTKALRKLKRKPDDILAIKEKEECRIFFEREIGRYSSLDGRWIMKSIKRRIENESGRRTVMYRKRKR